MKKLSFVAVLVFAFSCNETTQTSQPADAVAAETDAQGSNQEHHSVTVDKVFEAHGSYDLWNQMNHFSYNSKGSTTTVQLKSRHTLIQSDEQTVGFDGEQVWVHPPSENAERQKMRYNLMFYFLGFPFIVGDPGIVYDDLPATNLAGKTYNLIKISYHDGVGDSPKDNYILCINPDNNQMEWLMYTATFGGEETKNKYSLIQYNGWQEVNGLKLPTELQWYQYENNQVGEPRGEPFVISDLKIEKSMPHDSLFAAPEGAQILK